MMKIHRILKKLYAEFQPYIHDDNALSISHVANGRSVECACSNGTNRSDYKQRSNI